MCVCCASSAGTYCIVLLTKQSSFCRLPAGPYDVNRQQLVCAPVRCPKILVTLLGADCLEIARSALHVLSSASARKHWNHSLNPCWPSCECATIAVQHLRGGRGGQQAQTMQMPSMCTGRWIQSSMTGFSDIGCYHDLSTHQLWAVCMVADPLNGAELHVCNMR